MSKVWARVREHLLGGDAERARNGRQYRRVTRTRILLIIDPEVYVIFDFPRPFSCLPPSPPISEILLYKFSSFDIID